MPVYLQNSYLISEQFLYQFYLINLSLEAKLNQTDAKLLTRVLKL